MRERPYLVPSRACLPRARSARHSTHAPPVWCKNSSRKRSVVRSRRYFLRQKDMDSAQEAIFLALGSGWGYVAVMKHVLELIDKLVLAQGVAAEFDQVLCVANSWPW